MKNIQFVFAIMLISSLFSTLSAQNKKWEIGGAYSATFLKINQKVNATSDGGSSSSAMATLNLFTTRSIAPQIDFGFGIGQSWLDYQLNVNKTTHQLDAKVHFSDRPDFAKKPQTLDDIQFNNQYVNIPIFAKIKLSKNAEKSFQPAFGLRLDNYFLQKSSSHYDFDRGGSSVLGGLFWTVFTGNPDYLNIDSGQEWDRLTAGQRQEVAEYYDEQNSKYAMMITPSISFDWKFKNVGFGVEPFFVLASKKVNSDVKTQPGGGVRTYFSIRF